MKEADQRPRNLKVPRAKYIRRQRAITALNTQVGVHTCSLMASKIGQIILLKE